MDYYRRYVGDYLAKTLDLTMIQDGAYGRLLDEYYSKERPLPGDIDEIMRIARAMKPQEREAVRIVMGKKFTLEADGLYHNTRADKELGIAVPKIEKLREVARENGKKGGRPRKEKPGSVSAGNQSGLLEETGAGSQQKPEPVQKQKQPAHLNHPPTASHHPEPNPSDHRFPGVGDSEAQPPKAVDEALPARVLAECVLAKLEDSTVDNAMIQRWISHGATPTLMANALTEARRTVHSNKPLTCAYVDPIIERLMAQAREVRAAADASIARSRGEIDEQREAAKHAAPMPDHLKPRKRAASA